MTVAPADRMISPMSTGGGGRDPIARPKPPRRKAPSAVSNEAVPAAEAASPAEATLAESGEPTEEGHHGRKVVRAAAEAQVGAILDGQAVPPVPARPAPAAASPGAPPCAP